LIRSIRDTSDREVRQVHPVYTGTKLKVAARKRTDGPEEMDHADEEIC